MGGVEEKFFILYGLATKARQPGAMVVVGRALSYAPYGFMIPKNNPTMLTVANRTLARLFRSGELATIYTAGVCTGAAVPQFARQLAERLSGPASKAIRDRIDMLYNRQLQAVEEVVGLSIDEFDRLNKALTRLERFWTDQILYRL